MFFVRRSILWIPLALLVVGAGLSWWMQRAVPDPDSTAPAESPDEVVLFGPNLNEMAAVLGYADRLVAITDYCVWPPRILHLPRIGGQLDPDLETLALLHPDLLVIQGESPLLRSFAQAQGLRVADLKMDDAIDSILEGAVRLDRLLGGDGARGQAVAESLRAELDAIASSSEAAAGPRPLVLLVLARDPDGLGNLLTAGAGTFLDELVGIAGGGSWAGPRTRGYANVALETLAAEPPQLVIELSTADASADEERAAAPWNRMLEPDPRVEVIHFDGVMVPGPRIVETARRLRDVIAEATR